MTEKIATCCSVSGDCHSMSKEECVAKGCKSPTCKFMHAGEVREAVSKSIMIEKTNTDGKVKATVKTMTNGKEDVQNFEGTEAEVQAKIDALK